MIRNFIAAFMLSISTLAVADGVIYSWGIPTERVDGSPLLAEDVLGYSLRYSIDGANYPIAVINANQNELVIPGTAGTWVASIATLTAEGVGPYSPDLVTIVDNTPQEAKAKASAPTGITMLIICDDLSDCRLEIK